MVLYQHAVKVWTIQETKCRKMSQIQLVGLPLDVPSNENEKAMACKFVMLCS